MKSGMDLFRAWRRVALGALSSFLVLAALLRPAFAADDVTARDVLKVIEDSRRFLSEKQNRNGSWGSGDGTHRVGITSLVLLALLNAGMPITDEPARKGLEFLRSIKEPEPRDTYDISLMISALAAAKDGQRDKPRLLALANKLERGQLANGCWSYNAAAGDLLGGNGDRSNGQYAVLGLRDAADAGIPVEREVWRKARDHWLQTQNADGGWDYSGPAGQSSTGSMTVAGLSTLVITETMLGNDKDFKPDGMTPNCCYDNESNTPLERAVRWMGENFAVGHNPRSNRTWHLYYLYGLERAGRLSGERFFGEHDWYRSGARYLVESQTRGFWKGEGTMEQDPVIASSFALLFLSKGLAPVLINKIQYGAPQPVNRIADGSDWNRHRNDIRNLTEMISGLPRWPRLVTWQTVNIATVEKHGNVQDLLQSPIAYISGRDAPQFTDRQVELLSEYVSQGGFLFAVGNCGGGGFDQGIRDLVRRMYPKGDAELKRLAPDHPIFRAEHLLDPETIHLEGVDLGCRTPIVYSPDDLSCFWDKWARQDPPKRNVLMKSMITRATRIGTNVVAYATGREPANKLDQTERVNQAGAQDKIERGFLQIAKLRHTGGWDAAPQALRNILLAVNQTAGASASTKTKNFPATDPNLFKYPVVFMHGRNSFTMNKAEREQLKEYLTRGGVLFADAACGSRPFDQSFRSLMGELFAGTALKRIPADHEMFTTQVGHDIRRVKRRIPEVDNPKAALNAVVQEGEPFLEGIEIDGRWAVIYSKYDLSCTLERQSSVACAGYVPEDAVRIAVNIVLYAMLQDIRYVEPDLK